MFSGTFTPHKMLYFGIKFVGKKVHVVTDDHLGFFIDEEMILLTFELEVGRILHQKYRHQHKLV